MQSFTFINEPLKAWFIWLGAMLLFLIAWNNIIAVTARGVRAVSESV